MTSTQDNKKNDGNTSRSKKTSAKKGHTQSQQPATRRYIKKNSSKKTNEQKGKQHSNTTNGKAKSASSRPTKKSQQTRKKKNNRQKKNKLSQKEQQEQQGLANLPPLADGDLRVVPVCGVEWIGTNMTFIEYKDEIIVIDAGIGFSTPTTPGIDYTIPNTAYLEANKHKIKALVITHGHLDHVGAIPFVMGPLGNPPIYTREFGAMFVKKKLEEFPQLPKANIEVVDEQAGYIPVSEHLKVKFFGLTHSIPDSAGIIVQTPLGGVVSTGDVRVENHDGVVVDDEYEQYEMFKDENILLMTMDSTGIEKPGWTISEEIVANNVDKIIRETQEGRLFIAAFSSQVERIMKFMESAKKHNKYVVLEGRSMKNNMAIAEALELTGFDHVIPMQEMDQYPDHQLMILITGSQGEEFAALNRMSKGTHKHLKLQKNDTIVLSSSVVPGNEFEVSQLKNRLYRGSYNIVTYLDDQVHASGHGAHEELKWIHTQVPYKFFMPVHGEHYMLKMHAKMAEKELDVSRDRIAVPDNGSIIEIRDNGDTLVTLDEKIPAEPRIVEGQKVKQKQEAVFKDRQQLAEDGIFILVVALDPKTGRVKKSPDIISRGFVYLRDNQDLLQEARDMIVQTTETAARGMKQIDFDFIKQELSEVLGKFLAQKTHKDPIVIPVVLGL